MAKKSARRRGSALDPIMAAFAAGAVGFALFALPDGLFAGAVEASGLPSVLPAAQPPLGATARFAAIGAAAAATFLMVWLLLRSLGGKPAQPKRRSGPVEIDVPLPRIRRADAHPDAPARRPILAGLELGVPLDEAEEDEAEPQYNQFEDAEEAEAATEVEAQPEASQDEELSLDRPLPSFMVTEQPEEERFEQATEEAFEEPAYEPSEETDWLDGGFDEPVIEEEEAAQSSSPPEAEDASIPHLMQRLELGLVRRERADWMADPEDETAARDKRPELDDRLRNAIHDLQRLASRGG